MTVAIDSLEEEQLASRENQANGTVWLQGDIAPGIAALLLGYCQSLVAGRVVDPERRGVVEDIVDGVAVGPSINHAVVSVEHLHQDPQTLDGCHGFEIPRLVVSIAVVLETEPDRDVANVQLH